MSRALYLRTTLPLIILLGMTASMTAQRREGRVIEITDDEELVELPSTQEILARLDAARAQREEEMSFVDVWDAQPTTNLPRLSSLEFQRDSLIEIVHRGEYMGCIWELRSVDDPEADPIRLIQDEPRVDWLILEPGTWEISIAAGDAQGNYLQLRSQSVGVQGGRRYSMTFDREVERHVEQQLIEHDRNMGLLESRRFGVVRRFEDRPPLD